MRSKSFVTSQYNMKQHMTPCKSQSLPNGRHNEDMTSLLSSAYSVIHQSFQFVIGFMSWGPSEGQQTTDNLREVCLTKSIHSCVITLAGCAKPADPSSCAHLSRGSGVLQRESVHKQLQGVVPHASIGCCQVPEEQRVVQPQQHGISAGSQALGMQALQHVPQGRGQGRAGCPQGTFDQAL